MPMNDDIPTGDPAAIGEATTPSYSPHPAVLEMMQWFDYGHLPAHLVVISAPICELARSMAWNPDLSGPELTVGLRKLLEAKDALVRARLA